LVFAKERIGHSTGGQYPGQGLFPGAEGKVTALGLLAEMLSDIGGKQFYLADFVGKGKQRQKRLVKAAAEQFYLFAGNKIPDKKEKFRLLLLKPLKKGAGKVQRRGDFGIAVEYRDKRLKPGTVEFLKFIIFRAGGKMIMIT
jgi:hypothetical protein